MPPTKSNVIPLKQMTRGEKVIRFIEVFCRTPEGRLVGKPIKLLDFQKKFILAIYDNPNGTRRAILSMARKNGKSALIAALVLVHLCGPEAQENSQIISGAMSREQAALIFKLASKMIRMNEHLKNLTSVVDSKKTITGLVKNVEYRAISAEATTAHGLSPVLAILDEIGQIVGDSSPFVDAITTSQGAYDNPLLIAISTSAPSDTDLLSLMIDDAIRSQDPHTICHEYRADKDCDLLDKEQWKKANPALGAFRNERDLEEQLKEAVRLPHKEAAARNLLLNQRVSLVKLWLSPSVWRDNGQAIDLAPFREPFAHVSLGLDLSEKTDLTAAVLSVKAKDETVHVLPFCFIPAVGIEEKEKRDKQPYFQHIKNGHLFPVGTNAMSYEEVAEFMRDRLKQLDIEVDSVHFDRWKIENFKIACRAQNFLQDSKWVEVGQGYKDFSPRLDKVEELLLDHKVRHAMHPLLTSAAAHAIVVPSPAGDKKLDKSKTSQRIDPMVAMIMSVYGAITGAETAGALDWWVA